MRTVITHFFNEEYLLPWWLKHHVRLFDHGVLIDHGSFDRSAEICREIAPHWRLVRSRLMHFDAFTTDWEVMGFEQELPGWKIALNVTEFLMPSIPLADLETQLVAMGRTGCAASGVEFVDIEPDAWPSHELSLPLQKHFGIDDNAVTDPGVRASLCLNVVPARNRYYHCNSLGRYAPGRHSSYHPDSRYRVVNLVLGHFGFAPWNEETLKRRMQIGGKIGPTDRRIGFGNGHESGRGELQRVYEAIKLGAGNLLDNDVVRAAIKGSCV
jgi:hypothetical protein